MSVNTQVLQNTDPNNNNTETISSKLEQIKIKDEQVSQSNGKHTAQPNTDITEEKESETNQSQETADQFDEPVQGLLLEEPTDYETHPLESRWTLWFMNSDNKVPRGHTGDDSWNQGLMPLHTFGTIEEFWSCYNHIQLPAKLRVKHDYMLFREGVKPAWEDVKNKEGGMWKLVLPTKMRATDLDRMWLETLLSLIGEGYGDLGDEVMGAYLQRRQREDRIQLWTSQAEHKEQNMNVGKVFKSRLNLTNDSYIHYLKHDDSGATGQKHQSWPRKHKTDSLYTV